ncbi:DUF485 domain-containing protein [Pseudoclavibacter chungangensis]|uniref:DUF485 domain-containing protein n=1 Tax=Pseudoclavibacter chungangensis TaxID=587635 RepID=A0A7J5BQL1_9MICO|nr:DUF485 domain-containing protein [Pseudoclavibacter chungangensis]KAB1655355.1 DUF485 domain-containing protein [Pseudoclavibacter chungangensis]NYJ68305.1 uncharacterized membrane protein (DUF485 family) [Pseudoclavibacter chungangensis]
MSKLDPTDHPDPTEVDYLAFRERPLFKRLRTSQRKFVFPLAVFFLLWYLAYVLLAAYAPDFMATPVFGLVNIGIILGLLQFVTTFAITTWYVMFANRTLDPMASELRHDLESIEAGTEPAGDRSGEARA